VARHGRRSRRGADLSWALVPISAGPISAGCLCRSQRGAHCRIVVREPGAVIDRQGCADQKDVPPTRGTIRLRCDFFCTAQARDDPPTLFFLLALIGSGWRWAAWTPGQIDRSNWGLIGTNARIKETPGKNQQQFTAILA
jgi:hypothetical protein